MADTKVSDLTGLTTPATSDEIYIVDKSDTTDGAAGTSKKISYGNLIAATLTELGVTSSVAELNILDGVTAAAAEINILDGATLTVTELNYVDGVTSAIQTQLDAKAPTASPVFSGSVDLNGIELIIDADADTSLTADTDDRIDYKLGGSDRFRMGTADFDIITATGNITVAGADPWRTVSIFGGMKPTTTAGCAQRTTIEAGTNDIDYDVLDFDASSDENAFVNFQMPDSWDGGVIQFRYVWTNASGLTTETVTFELSARAYADSDAIDQAVGTPIEVADTWLAQGDNHISAWSSDVTVGGSPAGGRWVHFEIMRDVSEDTLTGDARLMDVQIKYKQAQFTD